MLAMHVLICQLISTHLLSFWSIGIDDSAELFVTHPLYANLKLFLNLYKALLTEPGNSIIRHFKIWSRGTYKLIC